MAVKCSEINIHVVLSPANSDTLISDKWKDDLHNHITKYLKGKGHELLAINSMCDHMHVFINFKTISSVSDIVKEIQYESANYINEHNLVDSEFSWQERYGAFSYSRSQIKDIIKDIINQREQHKQMTFREEYRSILNQFEISCEDKYLFEWHDCLKN